MSKIEESIMNMMVYNGLEKAVYELNKAISNHPDKWFTFDDACKLFPEIRSFSTYENFLWGTLVLMFGEYGTSPRVGWIEQKIECCDFLSTLIKLFIKMYYNDDEEEFYNEIDNW